MQQHHIFVDDESVDPKSENWVDCYCRGIGGARPQLQRVKL